MTEEELAIFKELLIKFTSQELDQWERWQIKLYVDKYEIINHILT